MIRAKYQSVDEGAAQLLLRAKEQLGEREHESSLEIASVRKKTAGQITTVREKARNRGYGEGHLRASDEFAKRVLEMERSYQHSIRSAHQDCLNIALKVAEEVLESEVRTDTHSISLRISKALETMLDQRMIRISVHPGDEHALDVKLKSLDLGVGYKVYSDEGIEPGSAHIESASGLIELNWRANLKEIAAELETKFRYGAAA